MNIKVISKKRPGMSKLMMGNKNSAIGADNNFWKGGVSKIDGYANLRVKRWRHRVGISKKYRKELGISNTEEYKKLQRQKYKSLKKNGGQLLIKTIQLVYEDNIKKYGTLTCYLCIKPIDFGKDHLEHKIPLSRGGTNERDNLDIACQKCNCRKYNKTEDEYRKENSLCHFSQANGLS